VRHIALTGMPLLGKIFAEREAATVGRGKTEHRHLFGELDARE
jgi:hypothetical protein